MLLGSCFSVPIIRTYGVCQVPVVGCMRGVPGSCGGGVVWSCSPIPACVVPRCLWWGCGVGRTLTLKLVESLHMQTHPQLNCPV